MNRPETPGLSDASIQDLRIGLEEGRPSALQQRLSDLQRRQYMQLSTSPEIADRIRAAETPPFVFQRFPDLFLKLFSDPNPRVRAALIGNWSARHMFPQEYEQLFSDSDPLVRQAVISSLSIILKRRDLVQAYFNDPHIEVRLCMAQHWFPRLGAEKLLLKVLEEERENSDLQQVLLSNRFVRSRYQRLTARAETQ